MRADGHWATERGFKAPSENNGLSQVLCYTVTVGILQNLILHLRTPEGYRNMLSTVLLIKRVQDWKRSFVPKIFYDKN